MSLDEQRRGDPDGARRAELLDKLLGYSATHGLSEVSLRPLAAAVGSSPRVLLYFFGSKAELVREVHRHARREQLRVLDEALHGHADGAAALRALGVAGRPGTLVLAALRGLLLDLLATGDTERVGAAIDVLLARAWHDSPRER